jgi:DNA-binding response OmpR family regulator
LVTRWKVLVVEDDPNVVELVSLYLEKEGLEVSLAIDGEAALGALRLGCYDLVILDIMLPGMDGLEVCREIRKESSVPIIMLTARDEDLDKILGLELGADDYVTKPFNPRELLARVKAVLRRFVDRQGDGRIVRGNLEVNIQDYYARINGKTLQVTPRETELLYFLASHPGKVFTREQLLENVWGYEYLGDARTVDTHVKRLRQKLRPAQGWEIKTIWGVGYKFDTSA